MHERYEFGVWTLVEHSIRTSMSLSLLDHIKVRYRLHKLCSHDGSRRRLVDYEIVGAFIERFTVFVEFLEICGEICEACG